VEIAVVTLSLPDLSICDEFDTLLNPERDIGAQHIHGISPDMVVGAPTFGEVAATLAEYVHGAVLVCHNIGFDVPFLAHEFTRAGGVFHPGTPRCTLAATRQKLSVVCRYHDIPLTDAHSALADARATALLARKTLSLGLHGPAQVEVCAQAQAMHTLRRNRDSASRLGRIIERARYPETDEATRLYLNALDYVLDDFVIEAAEQDTLDELAVMLGMTPRQRRDVHASYFQSLVDAAQRDNVITTAEHRLLKKVHAALMLPAGDLPKADEANGPGRTIPMGTSICFSGEAFIDGKPVPRRELEAMARAIGLKPVAAVTKRGCGLLVADPDSHSTKARNARKWDIPILAPEQFWSLRPAR
jgi:DNA polymerase-3 subunit epsilon